MSLCGIEDGAGKSRASVRKLRRLLIFLGTMSDCLESLFSALRGLPRFAEHQK
jgi:hypothetical protein